MPLVVAGFAIWALATGLRCMFDQDTDLSKIIGILIVEGVGIGFTLQPSTSLSDHSMASLLIILALIGLLANSKEEDRAVLTGLRNFLRTIGGAFGITSESGVLKRLSFSNV